MISIILAGGKATRFGDQAKCLLSLGEETILERQVRQARRYCDDIRVVAMKPEIGEMCNTLNVPIIYGFEGVPTLKAVHNTRDVWDDYTVILWGDVIFSEDAIDKVYTIKGLHDFGSVVQREGFAITFDIKDAPRFIESLEKTEFREWWFYRYLTGVPCQAEKYDKEIFVDITDWTTDIDFPDQYELFMDTVVKKGRLDDKA